jgi:NAD(P)H-flavin reductase
MQAEGRVSELLLLEGQACARLQCPPGIVPGPGQYVLAHAHGSDAALASVLFAARALQDGFVAAPPLASTWVPGTRLRLRGPLGHGFAIPTGARRIVLAALGDSARVLISLLEPALRQEAEVTLVSKSAPDDLPLQVEAQPVEELWEACQWADYVALDIERDAVSELWTLLQARRTVMKAEAQILVRAPMPCGALAACGACTVEAGGEALLACEDGPVFDLRQLMGWSSRA